MSFLNVFLPELVRYRAPCSLFEQGVFLGGGGNRFVPLKSTGLTGKGIAGLIVFSSELKCQS